MSSIEIKVLIKSNTCLSSQSLHRNRCDRRSTADKFSLFNTARDEKRIDRTEKAANKSNKASKNVQIHKITKIVCALWLTERSVCMRVCKHGCGVKLFGFSRANHASTNLKKFSSSKLDKFTLFTHSFVRSGKSLRRRWVNFLRLSWHFKLEKSVFCKASFCKTRTDYACKTSWTRFCDW